MKVEYTPEILNFITIARELFPANTVPSYVPKEEREVFSWPDGLYTLIIHGIAKSLAVTATKGARCERFSNVHCATNSTIHPTHAEVTFSINKGFTTREELLAWVAEHQLDLPTECNKTGVLVEDQINTMVTHKITIDDLTLNLFYTRQGAPTPKCRVEIGTCKTVVCDLPEDTITTEVPF
jgi:hypothetical protein